jgi:hypothetical protein
VPGDVVELDLHAVPPDVLTRWTITVRDERGQVRASSRHSTLAGTPLNKEDLLRTSPAHVPQLTPRGAARRTALGLIDGERSLAAIEAELAQRHPDLFGSPEAASAFVARVVDQETG